MRACTAPLMAAPLRAAPLPLRARAAAAPGAHTPAPNQPSSHPHPRLASRPASHLTVVVFNLTKPGNVLRAILGDEEIGTSIGCAASAAAASLETDTSETAADVHEQHC